MRLPRAELSHQEAVKRIEIAQFSITMSEQVQLYWQDKIDKPLNYMDILILGSDKTTPSKIVERCKKKRKKIRFLIENYYNRFVVRTNEGILESPIDAQSSEVSDEIPITLEGRAKSRLSQLKLEM